VPSTRGQRRAGRIVDQRADTEPGGAAFRDIDSFELQPSQLLQHRTAPTLRRLAVPNAGSPDVVATADDQFLLAAGLPEMAIQVLAR
jgi:hypothetical protein